MDETNRILSPQEYIIVSDKTSRVLKSGVDLTAIKLLAKLIREAGGEVTIFKAIKG